MKLAERRERVRRIVEPYLTAKRDRTQISQYGRIKPGPDGRVRTVLSTTGTETSRLSSSESICDKGSTNLQNLSKRTAADEELYQVRDCIVADPGMTLLAVDFDGAEAVCLAAYARDWDFYEKLIRGEDIHSWHAGHFFNEPAWRKGQRAPFVQRQVSKNATYASNYKASVFTITVTVNAEADKIGRKVTQKEIQKIRRMYLNLHPLERWWQDTARTLKEKGEITNALGLRREFFNPNFEKRLKEALAFLPQSTVACRINQSMEEIYEEIDEDGVCELLLQIHDELLFQIKEEEVPRLLPRIVEIMERPFTVHEREVYIPASGKVGYRWGQMKEISPN